MLSLDRKFLWLLLTPYLFACGGGTDRNELSHDGGSSGVFVDSPVEGLRWVSAGVEGLTDAKGTFQYTENAKVALYVGDILIGEATGDTVLIPVDLVPGAADITDPEVTNIVRFLMTLDNDANPTNGIEISGPSANLAQGQSLNFAQSTEDFTASGGVQTLVAALTSATDAGARSLVLVADAQAHVENTIKDLLAGRYTGTYSGSDSGSWEAVIGVDGVLTGSVSTTSGVAVASGVVSTNGSGTTSFDTAGAVAVGATFIGTFRPNGTGSGTWSAYGGKTGSWSGSKSN